MNPRPHPSIPLLLVLLIPAAAFAGGQDMILPDMFESTLGTRTLQEVSVLICPAGDGSHINQAMLFGGGTVDATIEVYLRDLVGYPIADYSYDDIWLEAPGLNFAPGGNLADFNSQSDGYTEFALPMSGGGCMETPSLQGYVSHQPFLLPPLPFIRINSPDMNGDLVVNLVDLGVFASTYFSGYSYCADLHWDGKLDLADVALFAQHFGHGSP